MAKIVLNRLLLTRIQNSSPFSSRQISVSSVNSLDQQWRKARGLSENPNKNSVLCDGPDYTFIDGRPTPYGARHKRRIIKQREYTAKIVQLTKEIDFAFDRHNKIQEEKQANIDARIKAKLKEKGNKVLT